VASSPGWPVADVQASVKGVRGAVTRREAALVGDAERRGGEKVEEAEVAGVRGSRGSGSSSRAALASRRAVLFRAPPSSSFSSPSPSPPAAGRWTGDWIPRAARVGESQGWRRRLLIAAVERGTWMARMRREAVGHVATAAMTGARGLWPFDASQSAKGG
jgi:hypothetical protein